MYIDIPKAGTYFIFDTNVYLQHLEITLAVAATEAIVVPRVVIRELHDIIDTHWRQSPEVLERADEALRFIGEHSTEMCSKEDLLYVCDTSLSNVEYGEMLKMFGKRVSAENRNDNLILYFAQQVKNYYTTSEVAVVTEDRLMGGSAISFLENVLPMRPQELYCGRDYEQTPDNYWKTC